MTDEIRDTVPAAAPKAETQRTDKFAERRNAIKKHKRKAHRRKINASNRPG